MIPPNIDSINKILISLFITFNENVSGVFTYLDVCKYLYDYIEKYKDNKLFIDLFIQFRRVVKKEDLTNCINLIKYVNLFNNDKQYMLKFRRPYLHFLNQDYKTIVPFERFDIDIIFSDLEDLSFKPSGYHNYKQFISNYTAEKSIELDILVKSMYGENAGVYTLFNKIFNKAEQDSLLSAEYQIFNDLKHSINSKLNDDRIYFKHYAIDYIIDTSKQLNVLEVNDSPVIQKDTIKFIDFIIYIIINEVIKKEIKIYNEAIAFEKEEYIKTLDLKARNVLEAKREAAQVRESEERSRLKPQKISNLEDIVILPGGSNKYKEKYLKYKHKYNKLKANKK
jgi:hypothetical protein